MAHHLNVNQLLPTLVISPWINPIAAVIGPILRNDDMICAGLALNPPSSLSLLSILDICGQQWLVTPGPNRFGCCTLSLVFQCGESLVASVVGEAGFKEAGR